MEWPIAVGAYVVVSALIRSSLMVVLNPPSMLVYFWGLT